MKNWEEKRISKLGKIVTGKTPPKSESDYWDGDELFVSPKDMDRDSFYIWDTQAKITGKALDKFKSQRLPKDAVMYTSLSYGFGKIGVACKDLITNQQITSIISNDENNFRFIYYLLRVNTPYIFSYNSGIDTPIVPKSVFEKIKLFLPSLPIQRKITAVLTAYDDLLENNNRRIAILENMAEELYREWFVRLRFPGYEKVKVVKGVPEGWEVVELNKIASEVSKSTKPGAHLSNRKYVPIDQLQQRHFNIQSHLEYDAAQSSLITFEAGDILFGAMRPYLHKVCIAPTNGITRTTCFVIRPKDTAYFSFLYLMLFQKSTTDYATIIANGADRPYVVWNKSFERMNVYKPSKCVALKFNDMVVPIINKVTSYYIIDRNLKKTRDRLLSRLMSGKIDVENLDIKFPESMLDEVNKVAK